MYIQVNFFYLNREYNETETEKSPYIPPAPPSSTTSTTTTPKPTISSTTTPKPTTTSTTTPKPTTTSTTTMTIPTITSSTTTKPTIPRRYPYYPRANHRPRTTSTTATPRRPFNYPNYPRRPELSFTTTEVTITDPRDPFVVTAEKQPDGSYGVNTSAIPKDTWSILSEKDKPESEFNPNDLHCLDGYERNDRGECVGEYNLHILFLLYFR